MSKKNVGIVSCYFKNNYGSILQAFATQQILNCYGIANCTIDISGFRREILWGKFRHYLRNLLNLRMYRAKFGFLRHIYRRKLNKTFAEAIRLRYDAFDRFREANFTMSERFSSKVKLSESSKRFSDFLLGSDQLWLPVNIEGNYYTLNFVPDEVNKIAYATSFGVSSLPKYLHVRVKAFLSRIEHLSVREESAVRLIREIAGRDARLVCDPVLLLAPEQWEGLITKAAPCEAVPDNPYIFCYFMGDNPQHRSFVSRLKALTGADIVVLRHLDAYIPEDDRFGDFVPWAVGPAQFLSLLYHAQYVCTDSFHCTAFSILFQKKFFTFQRFQRENSQSTNNRIDSLLTLTGLRDRLFYGDEDLKLPLLIDYSRANVRLRQIREESLSYLLDALGVENGEEPNQIGEIR